jgi:hypothetical protein
MKKLSQQHERIPELAAAKAQTRQVKTPPRPRRARSAKSTLPAQKRGGG